MKIDITKGKMIVEDESIDERSLVRSLMLSMDNSKLTNELLEQKSKKLKQETSQENLEPTFNNTYISKSPTLNTTTDYKFKFSETDKFKKLDECKQSSNPNRFNTGSVAITMETLDRPDIDQIADIDKDICGYDRIRVFDSMERKSDITIINDGPDSIYFVVNRNGIDHEEEMWSQAELMIYPGEAWKIYHVHELRIRSETQGNKYRITEDDIISTSTIRSVT